MSTLVFRKKFKKIMKLQFIEVSEYVQIVTEIVIKTPITRDITLNIGSQVCKENKRLQ